PREPGQPLPVQLQLRGRLPPLPGARHHLHRPRLHGPDDHDLRRLVHRTGLLLIRTPEGAARFDRALVDLSRHVPGFAAAVTGWLAHAPQEWAAVVGPSSRRTIENLAGVTVPA
ncbi:hypothetical protein, partial [Streptomyces sp. 15-116A]|uniref:hypothetical protein n=1 Tax=Streptomyces sp. 15-116A TaxID=2259035 RepID=UPI0037D99DEC